MTLSYNNRMATSANPRLENLLAALTLNLAEEAPGRAGGGRGAVRERRGGAGRPGGVPRRRPRGTARRGHRADPLGRRPTGHPAGARGARRATGRRRPASGRGPAHRAGPRPGGRGRGRARDAVVRRAVAGLTGTDADALEGLLDQLVSARVEARVEAPPGGSARRGLVVPHLRLRRVRETRGPLPGPGHRGPGAQSLGSRRGHPDHAEHPQRRLRAARRGGRPDRQRRLGARRRDGQPLRPEPDLRAHDGRGAGPEHRRTPRRAPDDRGPRRQRAGVRRGRLRLGDLPRRGGQGAGAARPRDPGQGRPGRDGAQAGHADRALRGAAPRARHAAGDDRRARLRRPEVPRPLPAQDPHRPRS